MLQGVRIKNFRVFNDDKGGIILDDIESIGRDMSLSFSAGIAPAIPFSNLLALIGKNASGKSTFFDALSFASDCTTMGCATAATQHGREGFLRLLGTADKPMIFEFLFSMMNGKAPQNGPEEIMLSYRFELASDSHGRPHYASEKVILCRLDESGKWTQKVCLDLKNGRGTVLSAEQPIEGGVSDTRISALRSYGAMLSFPELSVLYHEISHWYFCNFSVESSAPRHAVAPGGHKHLNCDGSNLENVLDYLEEENPALFQTVMNKIADKIPSIKKEKGRLPDSFKKSPNKLFLYLLLLDDPMPRPLICVEAPDMGLYHDMVDVLASEFRQYSVRHPHSQIIFTTHNPYILESMAPDEVWIFKRVEEDATNLVDIECAGANPIVSEMYRQGVGMGAIWYAGHFDD